MVNETTLVKFGFVKENDGLRLKQMIENKGKLKEMRIKEMHIDTYSENPFDSSSSFSLLLRASEKNATISMDNERLIFKRNDDNKTHFMNVLMSRITECYSKIGDSYSEFILNIQNIYYKITVFN